MKIAIFSRQANCYSTSRLKEAAKARGHQVEIIDTLRCYMNIAAANPGIYYLGKRVEGLDAVIPRIGASITFYGTAVVRQCEMMGIFTINGAVAIAQARDKLRSIQLLARKGIGLPVTGFAHCAEDMPDVIRLVGGSPVIIKLLEGAQGMGVVLAESQKAAESVMDAFAGVKANILVQEYIQEAAGSDIRCFVIDGEVVAAMKRQAKAGEFRSNLHRGGSSTPIEISAQERTIAIQAVKAMGLNVAGVDILRSMRGPVVLEVNSSPGLKGIETTTNLDVAGLIIEFIEKNAKAKGSGP